MKKITLIVYILLILCVNATAATYYVDTSATDDTGTGSEASPKKYINSGIALMGANDTLIIEDGVYTGSNNMITTIPSGSGGYTTIQARNIGGVTIDGESTNIPFAISNLDYLAIDGVIFQNSSGSVVSIIGGTSSIDHGHYKFTNCGFSNASGTGDVFFARYTEYGLLEDCFIWGNGRYRQYILDSRYWILRRTIDRVDRCIALGTNNSGSIRFYNSYGNIAQNCIFIDTDQETYYTVGVGGSFTAPNFVFTDGPDGTDLSQNQWIGCIGVNTPYADIYHHADDAGDDDAISNCFFWDFREGIWTRDTTDVLTVSNSVFGNTTSRSGVYSDSETMGIVFDSIFYGNATARSGFNTTATDYNAYYNNTTDFNSYPQATQQAHETLLINPLTNSMLYPCQIEPGSDLAGAGSAGGDIGPTILKQIGTSGTLYGDTGHNTTTETDLWPFPNEDIIKTKMAAYEYDDGSGGDPEITGARGFCAATANPRTDTGYITLTSYIWEYLGNTGMTATFYSAAPTVTITSPTTGGSTTDATITVSGTSTHDSELSNTGVSVNGVAATSSDGFATWTASGVSLSIGSNTITATVTQSDAQTADDDISYTRTSPPATITGSGATFYGITF